MSGTVALRLTAAPPATPTITGHLGVTSRITAGEVEAGLDSPPAAIRPASFRDVPVRARAVVGGWAVSGVPGWPEMQ